MRSIVKKAVSMIAMMAVALFVMAPLASAQGYESQSPTGDQILFEIQANNAAREASAAADAAAKAAANGDGAGAAAYAAKAQAAADKAADVAKRAKAAGIPSDILARVNAAAKAAAASAKAAAASAAGTTAVPLAVPAKNLAFTGSSVNLPVAAGSAMIGLGGLAVLFARKRENKN